jgi:hypothetical protein
MYWFGCSTCGTCQCEAAEISNEKGKRRNQNKWKLIDYEGITTTGITTYLINMFAGGST